MDDVVIQDAKQEAANEIAWIDQEIERLRERKAALEGFVVQADNVLGSRFSGLQHATPPSSEGVAIWRYIVEILRKKGRPMTIAGLVAALEQAGVVLKGEFKNQAVRSIVIRKDALFEKVEHKYFALREWPEIQKKLRIED